MPGSVAGDCVECGWPWGVGHVCRTPRPEYGGRSGDATPAVAEKVPGIYTGWNDNPYTGVRRYYAERFQLRATADGIPFLIRLRLMLDRETGTIRAVRSVHVTAPDGSNLRTADCAYIDDWDGEAGGVKEP